jgi:N-acetylmuramoyl-L-alanine amidase
MRKPGLAAASLAALLLASCGGGSDDGAGNEVQLGKTGPALAPVPAKRQRPAHASAAAARPAAEPAPQVPERPPITQRLIPFDARRMQETAAYAQRHYGEATTRLDPKVIVEHYTVIPTAAGVIDRFSRNEPDTELHERPGVCSHFLIDRDGTILQLVPVRLICRHTVGLNDVAIGIEHVGASDSEVMTDQAQLRASLRLTDWLRCRYGIARSDVIGHAESLSSPYHHEAVPQLARQTHDDFQPATMNRYRTMIGSKTCGGSRR